MQEMQELLVDRHGAKISFTKRSEAPWHRDVHGHACPTRSSQRRVRADLVTSQYISSSSSRQTAARVGGPEGARDGHRAVAVILGL